MVKVALIVETDGGSNPRDVAFSPTKDKACALKSQSRQSNVRCHANRLIESPQTLEAA
jgi:hypothetical protein